MENAKEHVIRLIVRDQGGNLVYVNDYPASIFFGRTKSGKPNVKALLIQNKIEIYILAGKLVEISQLRE